jgi:hypothetical protein
MKLVISVEAQNAFEIGLGEILREVNESIKSINDNSLVSESKYGNEFVSIGIIPSCMEEKMWTALGWKEKKLIKRTKREADIRIRMDYDRFIRESPSNKRLIFIKTIVESLKIVQEKSKFDFKGEELINDILFLLNVSLDELNNLNIL